MLQVENLTAKTLHKYLQKSTKINQFDISTLKENGIIDAEKWIHLPWVQLIDTLVEWVEPYEEKYITWANEANDEKDIFQFIADHENAILKSLKSEQQGSSGISDLKEFLNNYANI